jgi:hypothetical protein
MRDYIFGTTGEQKQITVNVIGDRGNGLLVVKELK